ncbi:MAG: methyltransferase domain-containing protein [Bacteroidia bacterium]|nr:methyltransferase domain-containing protein [Bacteroidia bacterium]
MSLKFGANAQTYNEASDVQRCIALYLAHTMSGKLPLNANIYEIGAGTGHLTRQLLQTSSINRYTINDVSQEMLNVLFKDLPNNTNIVSQCADAETAEWPQDTNVIVSSSAVQWFKEPLNLIRRAANLLPPGGLLAFSTFLPGTYGELLHLGKGLYYHSIEDWQGELEKCGFKNISINSEQQVVNFSSIRDLLLSIKHSGVQGNGDGKTPFAKLRQLPLKLTYNVIYVVANR